jgi:arylsulfatase A-like enzyme
MPANDLGCYGRKDHETPRLDRLAKQGIRFTSAYAEPVCSPTRAALLTGKAPARLHLTTFLPGRPDTPAQKLLHPKIELQLPLKEKTVATLLKEAGYTTACVGKWHLGGAGFGPEMHGFDMVHSGKANTPPSETEGGKGEYDLTRHALQFMDDCKRRPFFLYLAHNNPHIPLGAKPELVSKYKDSFNPTYAAMVKGRAAGPSAVLALPALHQPGWSSRRRRPRRRLETDRALRGRSRRVVQPGEGPRRDSGSFAG